MLRFLILLCLQFLFSLALYSQEYKVDYFDVESRDLTARTQPRVDANGHKCGVIKIYVKDAITKVEGSVVGDIVDNGFEKNIYVCHDIKQIKLHFKEHMPLHIVFDDYNYTTLSGNMTYILKLSELSNPVASNVSTPQNTQPPATTPDTSHRSYQATSPLPSSNSASAQSSGNTSAPRHESSLTSTYTGLVVANDPKGCFDAGKEGIDLWKKMESLSISNGGNLSEADGLKAATALISGYENLLKVIEMEADSNKPKYTKDAIKLISDSEIFQGLNLAGVYFFNGKDFRSAYHAWDMFSNLPEMPRFAKNKNMTAMVTPEMKKNLLFNQGIAAYMAEEFPTAYDAFSRVVAIGYDDKNAYDYALYAAIQMKDAEKIRAAAMQAHKKFGKEDPQYISQIINGYIKEKNFSQALSLIDQAIADSPGMAQYYFIKGIVQEEPEVGQDPMASYQKAVELDPNNDSAWYQMGYNAYIKSQKVSENAPVKQDEFDKVKKEQIDPLLRKTIEYVRKAYMIRRKNGGDLHDPEIILKNAYYELGEDYNQQMKDIL